MIRSSICCCLFLFFIFPQSVFAQTCDQSGGEDETCEDTVRREPLGCEVFMSSIGPVPLPNSQDESRCCIMHDLCYTAGVPGSGVACDQELALCILEARGLIGEILTLPYGQVADILFGFGIPASIGVFKERKRDCYCEVEPPEAITNLLNDPRYVQPSKDDEKPVLKINDSMCCEEGECVEEGTCTAEFTVRDKRGKFSITMTAEGECKKTPKTSDTTE